MKTLSTMALLLLPLILLAVGCAGQPYGHNPALNPVAFHAAPRHEPVTLIQDGTPRFAIAFDHTLEADKSLHPLRRSVRHGAEALREAVKQCTGHDVPIVDVNDQEAMLRYPAVVVLGKCSVTDALGMAPMDLPQQGFEVRSFTGGIAIAGYDGSLRPEGYDKLDGYRIRQNGTANGVYDFIERFFGVRYYFPGPGVVWPKVAQLTVQPVRYTDAPVFVNRFTHQFRNKPAMDFGATYTTDDGKKEPWPKAWSAYKQDYASFVWRWRIARGSAFTASHSPTPQLWLAAHPDKKDVIFYTDPSGKTYYDPNQHIGNYYDVSNLELAELYAADARRFYDTGWDEPWKGRFQPNSKYVIFGQCDTFVADMNTPAIRKLNLIPESRRGNRQGELSDVYARFHIALAEKIRKTLPGKRLAIIPYHNYALPPVLPQYRNFPDNIDLRVCIYDFPSRITNPDRVAYWKKQLADWYDVLGGRPVVSMWLYNTYRSPWGKAVVARHIGEVPKKLGRTFGREGMYFDVGGLEWFHYPAYYAGFRAMWNPDFNVQAALDESWPLLYGNAAPYLKEFDDILVDRWVNVLAQIPAGSSEFQAYGKAFPVPLLDKMEKLLKQAEAALKPDSVEMLRYKMYATPWPQAIERMRGSLSFRKPTYEVRKVAGSQITVDGKVDESAWKNAAVIPMRDPFGGDKPMTALTGRMLWDEKGLYLSFEMAGKPKADPKAGTFKNDNVEIFLSPGTEADEYFQFAVSSTDGLWEGQRTLKPVPTPYNGNWTCPGLRRAVTAGEDGWSLELFVPYAGLGVKPPKAGALWQGNVIGNKLSEPAEYSSFSLTQGNNHTVDLFAYLKFVAAKD